VTVVSPVVVENDAVTLVGGAVTTVAVAAVVWVEVSDPE
jgi:hypothetical protein